MKYSLNHSVILFGGSSEERLVSVASAQNLSQKIPEARLWFMTREGGIHIVTTDELASHKDPFTEAFNPSSPVKYTSLKESLADLKGKIVIIGLHGTEGEDGKIQKTFEENGIHFTGTGSLASALAFDKIATKNEARKHGLPVVEELRVTQFQHKDEQEVLALLKKYGKIVLKPIANGSSVGLFIISDEVGLSDAFKKLQGPKDPYLAEPFITGREITVGVKETKDGKLSPLPCSEVRVIQGRQFDYNGKYLGSGVEELTPAPLTASESQMCQALALKVHEIMGCRGYSRTDMILTDKGPILLEINTLPGLSRASFIPQQLSAAGENLRDFFLEQINLK
jgi:D-alanine-D-alanine ligase